MYIYIYIYIYVCIYIYIYIHTTIFLACGTWVGQGAGGCAGCRELARRGGGGEGGARGPSLYV